MMRAIVVFATLFFAACGFAPGGDDYPYGMFDADVKRFAKLLQHGSKDGLVHTGTFGLDEDERDELRKVWGKAKKVKIIQTEHIRMMAFYFLDVELENGIKKRYRVGYVPNLGRVEMVFQLIDD